MKTIRRSLSAIITWAETLSSAAIGVDIGASDERERNNATARHRNNSAGRCMAGKKRVYTYISWSQHDTETCSTAP
jgi:hypothetical protein